MSLARRIAPIAMEALTGAKLRDARRTLERGRRRILGRVRELHYFHQADDPYGALAVQTLPALAERYDLALVPHLVAPPDDAAAPERALLEAFARRDAADIARGYGLAFPASAHAPRSDLVARAERVLALACGRETFVAAAARASAALWSADERALAALASEHGEASNAQVAAAIAAGTELRRRKGHYLSAMFAYEGEWYWGVDRLHHLERRLRAEGAARDPDSPLVAPRPTPQRVDRAQASRSASPSPSLVLDFFLSLRSPYTYIVTERVVELARRYGVELALKPVLPMVMRGLPVPRAKQLYIARDTQREASDAGVPFGRVCDPVGRPVERCFSLYPWARERGRAAELLLEFMRAAWSQGVDTGTDAGLRLAVERAGLAWSEAQQRVDGDSGWRAEVEANRAEMFALGLWGVPSFRVRGGGRADYSTWGQDRLWRVEQELAARLGVAPS